MSSFLRRIRNEAEFELDHKGYVDIHCHILCGLDDGAQTLEDSLALAEEAVDNGVSEIIATPHLNEEFFPFSRAKSEQACDRLRKAFNAGGIPIKLHLGAEVKAHPNILQNLANGAIPTLGQSRYLLLELPFDSIPPLTRELIWQVQLAGKVPIFAHPERHARIQRDPELLKPFLDCGCLIQINASSLTGRLGKSCRKTSIALLANGWVSFIGSDGHRAGARGIDLKEAVTTASKYVGPIEAQKLVRENPRAILTGKNILSIDRPVDTYGDLS